MRRVCDIQGGYGFSGPLLYPADVCGLFFHSCIRKSCVAAVNAVVSCGMSGGNHRRRTDKTSGGQSQGFTLPESRGADAGMETDTDRALSDIVFPFGMVYAEIVRQFL